MDPNANLFRQVTLATRVIAGADDFDMTELAELVLNLDNWIRQGGFLPTAWERKGK